MPPNQVRVTCNEIDAPFHKGTDNDEEQEEHTFYNDKFDNYDIYGLQ